MDKNAALLEDNFDSHWLEDLDAELPEALAKGKHQGNLPPEMQRIKVTVTVRELPQGQRVELKVSLTDTLREIFELGAKALGKPLLPPQHSQPLDILRCRKRHTQDWSEPLTNLELPLWLALLQGCTRRFGIEYVLAVKINTQWGVALASTMTPRELLTSFGFDPAQFSLYKTDSAEPLPPDTPLSLNRGDMFEAQKDGRYGNISKPSRPPRGSQTIEDEVKELKEAGVEVRLLLEAGQRYVEVHGIVVPSPPWSKNHCNILIAIPSTYPMGGLDAFYLDLQINHSSGSIPYLQSAVQLDSRSWGLISWHYANNRPWNALQDNLSTHIEHCRGAFLRRGVTQ